MYVFTRKSAINTQSLQIQTILCINGSTAQQSVACDLSTIDNISVDYETLGRYGVDKFSHDFDLAVHTLGHSRRLLSLPLETIG